MVPIAQHGFHTVINNRPDGEGGPDWSHKLKAAELLAKTQGDFIETRRLIGDSERPVVVVNFGKTDG